MPFGSDELGAVEKLGKEITYALFENGIIDEKFKVIAKDLGNKPYQINPVDRTLIINNRNKSLQQYLEHVRLEEAGRKGYLEETGKEDPAKLELANYIIHGLIAFARTKVNPEFLMSPEYFNDPREKKRIGYMRLAEQELGSFIAYAYLGGNKENLKKASKLMKSTNYKSILQTVEPVLKQISEAYKEAKKTEASQAPREVEASPVIQAVVIMFLIGIGTLFLFPQIPSQTTAYFALLPTANLLFINFLVTLLIIVLIYTFSHEKV